MTRLYLSNDTSSRAAGTGALVRAWAKRADVDLIRTSARGAFFLEPLVERDTPDGRLLWSHVRPGDLPRILSGEGGTPINRLSFLADQTRIAYADFGITQPLSMVDYVAQRGLKGLDRARQLSPADIVKELNISGLRGRGGAAYSVWKKWDVARRIDADCKYVVANADEGDAGTYCDRMMMEGEPFRLIEGMAICAQAIGADQGYIYCRQEYPIAQKVLQQAITIAEQAGMLDLEGRRFHIEVFGGAGAYVCGEETALLESLEGRRGVVRPKPPYPAAVGLYGRPTVVSNVLTFATVPSILACGGSWYASMGTEQSSGTIALQIGGRVKQPGLVEIPFGATLEEVLDRFGGGMAPGARFKAVQVGGPLGSLFPVEKLDIRICYDEFAKADAILGHGGIVVFDDETDMVEMARHFMAFTADESCGKCTPCRIGSVRAREILERIERGQGRLGDLEVLADLGETMRTASLCALGGRAPYPVLTAIEHFGHEFMARHYPAMFQKENDHAD